MMTTLRIELYASNKCVWVESHDGTSLTTLVIPRQGERIIKGPNEYEVYHVAYEYGIGEVDCTVYAREVK